MKKAKKAKTPAAFAGTTKIAVVLDKSGSMGIVRDETIGGFNMWLDTIQKNPERTLFSLTLFDTQFSTPIRNVAVEKVNHLDHTRYMPDGSTRLNDAILATIHGIESEEKVGEDVRYLVCILTDGQENASTHSNEEVRDAIRAKEALGNWTFTYLSAGLDAFADAASYGIAVGNTQAYTGDAAGTSAAFVSSARNTANLMASAHRSTRSFYGGKTQADDADLDPVLAGPNPPVHINPTVPLVTPMPTVPTFTLPLSGVIRGSTPWVNDATDSSSSWTK